MKNHRTEIMPALLMYAEKLGLNITEVGKTATITHYFVVRDATNGDLYTIEPAEPGVESILITEEVAGRYHPIKKYFSSLGESKKYLDELPK